MSSYGLVRCIDPAVKGGDTSHTLRIWNRKYAGERDAHSNCPYHAHERENAESRFGPVCFSLCHRIPVSYDQKFWILTPPIVQDLTCFFLHGLSVQKTLTDIRV